MASNQSTIDKAVRQARFAGNVLPLLDTCLSQLHVELGLPYLPAELRRLISDMAGMTEPACRFVVVHRRRDYVLRTSQVLRDVIVRALLSYWFYSTKYALVEYDSKPLQLMPMLERLEAAYQDHLVSRTTHEQIPYADDWWNAHAGVSLEQVAARKQHCLDVLQGNLPLDVCLEHLFGVQATGTRHYRPVRSAHGISVKGHAAFAMHDPNLPRVDDQQQFLYY